MNNDWLQNLKAGDEVLTTSYSGRRNYVRTIDRMTPSLIVIGGDRYQRRTGRSIGDSRSIYRSRILEASPDQIAAVKEAANRECLVASISVRMGDASKIPTATLEAIWKLLEA
jgi:hypothetical protein